MIRSWFAALALAVPAACAAPSPEAMGQIDAAGLARHPQIVALAVSSAIEGTQIEGGESFVVNFMPSAETLEAAVDSAIRSSGFLAGIDPSSELRLAARLRRVAMVEGTELEFARSVRTVIDWSLEDGASELWASRVSTTHARTFEDDFSGDVRTRKAVEGSVRDNIARAFRELEESGVLAGGQP